MIAHALSIVMNELNRHLMTYDIPNADASSNRAVLGNLAEGFASGNAANGIPRNRLILSVVNIQEEKTLKNLPNYVRHDANLSVSYENPPVFLNLKVLLTATHSDYMIALLMLSRGIQFFQYRLAFTQDSVDPNSLTPPTAIVNELDQLESFKMNVELYSPSMEEVNHLWGTLGGKQYPFALYIFRMLDLKFRSRQPERGVITEITSNFYHKKPSVN
ncbi:Pvc16 family protein [Spirosoma pulveris]